jgi:hypothetical protein
MGMAVIAMIVAVVMLMAVKRQRTSGSCAEQSSIFWG